MRLIHGDCLNEMDILISNGIKADMILCDLPYGRTKNRWDSIIPFNELWNRYKKLIKQNGCIALFADGLFMAELINSNSKMWKYNLVWNKVLSGGFLNANRMPLRQHEEICIFYNKQPTYNPQKIKGKPNHNKGKPKICENNNYGSYEFIDNGEILGDMKHPTSIITVSKPHSSKMVHPTEKPVELCEWLIKTYTNETELIIDNCMGSGTTGIACKNLNRDFIGIEIESDYFELAENRIINHKNLKSR